MQVSIERAEVIGQHRCRAVALLHGSEGRYTRMLTVVTTVDVAGIVKLSGLCKE
jgi:hypothetical protein